MIKSIRFQLALWTVAVLAVILLAFDGFVYTRQAADLQMSVKNDLQVKTQQLELMYRFTGIFEGSDHQRLPDLGPQQGGALLPGDETLALFSPSGQILQTAGALDSAAAAALLQSWQQSSQNSTPLPYNISLGLPGAGPGKKTPYLFLVTPLLAERHLAGVLVLGQPEDPNGQMARLAVTLVLGSLATLGVALAGGYWLASRAMAPVRTITRTARSISESDLHQRLHLKRQDELGELAGTFDAMLDRLQAAFDRQRQFTADASHELRTPLTIIGLETEKALARRRTSGEYERSLKVIQSENEFMTRLVNDLLTLARMDAGQTQLRLELLDLSDIALDTGERLLPLTHQSGVELVLGDLPGAKVVGDRQYLSQMVSNLVENALKYAGGRGRHVWLETGTRPLDEKPYAWVQVKDDGPGIPAEHLPHLFDRFYQVDAARARLPNQPAATGSEKDPGGSGLGLSIVQWIAHAHGGQVSVYSEQGGGTTFEVTLPLKN